MAHFTATGLQTFFAVIGEKSLSQPINYPTREHAEAARTFNSHEYPLSGPWRVVELRQVASGTPTDPAFDAWRGEQNEKDESWLRGQYLAERALDADYEAWLYFDYYLKEVSPWHALVADGRNLRAALARMGTQP